MNNNNNWENPELQSMDDVQPMEVGFMCKFCRTVVTHDTYRGHLETAHPDKLDEVFPSHS